MINCVRSGGYSFFYEDLFKTGSYFLDWVTVRFLHLFCRLNDRVSFSVENELNCIAWICIVLLFLIAIYTVAKFINSINVFG